VGHAVGVLLPVELQLDDLVLEGVVSGRGHPGHLSLGLGRKQYFVVIEQVVFEHGTQDVAASEDLAGLDPVLGLELPLLVPVQRRQLHALGNEHRVAHGCNLLQGSLNSVENGGEDAGTEFHGQGVPGSQDGVAHRQA